jgi:hypothetical protein
MPKGSTKPAKSAKTRSTVRKPGSRKARGEATQVAKAEKLKPARSSDAAEATASLSEISKLLMLTPQRVRQLVNDGWIVQASRNVYSVAAAVQGYIKFLKDEERRTSKSAATSRLHDVRTREVELRMAREENRLVDIEDVTIAVGEIVGGFRSELAGLQAACTRDLALRRVIEKHLHGAIDRCRKRLEKAQRDNWSGGEGSMEGEEATAG